MMKAEKQDIAEYVCDAEVGKQRQAGYLCESPSRR